MPETGIRDTDKARQLEDLLRDCKFLNAWLFIAGDPQSSEHLNVASTG